MSMEDQSEIILVNCTPKEVYQRFEMRLLNELPADKPEFIALLERNDIIGKETKAKMDFPDQIRCGLAASIVQEIDTSPTFSDDKFYKLLSVMKGNKNGLEILAQEIETHLNPVEGPFDCWAMTEYLCRNRSLLDNLPCNQIRHDLLAYNIISQYDKMSMEHELDYSRLYLVINCVLSKLNHKQPEMFKTFLQIMERSGNTHLKKTAELLGGSERIPDTMQDISIGLPDDSQVIPFLTGLKKRKLEDDYEVEYQSGDKITNGVHNRPAEYPLDEINEIEMIKYPIISKTKPAFAVILNNMKFHNMSDRKGSDKDEDTILSLKEKFGGMIDFHDYTLNDLTANEIHGAFKMLAKHDPSSLSDTEIDGALKLFGKDKNLSLSIEEKRNL